MIIPLLITGGVLGTIALFAPRVASPREEPDPSEYGPRPAPVPPPQPSGEGPVGNFLADVRVKLGSVPFQRSYSRARADADRTDLEREAESLGLTNVTSSLDPNDPEAALFQHYRLGYTGPRDRVQKLPSFDIAQIRGPFQARPV